MHRPVLALARASARHPRLVLVAWLVLAVVLVAGSRLLGSALTDELTVSGSDSAVASDVIEQVNAATTDDGASVSTVLVAADGPVAERAAQVAALAAGLRSVDGVLDVVDPLAAAPAAPTPVTPGASAGAAGPRGDGGLSADGTAVQLRVTAEDDVDQPALRASVDEARDAGLEVGVGMPLLRDLEPGLDSRRSEIIGVVTAVLVLALALGSALAMSVPIASALVGVACGLAALQLVAHTASVPTIVPTLATMIGLGVGIDYALFQVARHQEVLRSASSRDDRVEAAARTAAGSGTAVAFAGVTVAVAISALAVTGVEFVSWLGWGTAIVVAVVLLGALTFTPAMLATLGARTLPRAVRRAPVQACTEELATDRIDASRWSRWGAWVARHPWVSAVVSLLLLGALAAPATALTLGQSSDADRPLGTERRTTYDLTTDRLGEGANAQLTLAVTLDPPAADAADPRLVALTAAAADLDGVERVGVPATAASGQTATARVVPTTGPSDPATTDLVTDLRSLDVPDGVHVHVGGPTAVRADLAERIAERLPWLILATVALASLLLVVAFRSLVLPLKAAVLDLVSVAAAYGVVTAVFEWGWGVEALGLDGPVAIDSYVPMMLFAVLFGLSMDYEVFLLASVREHWLAGADTPLAVRRGLASTGRIITAAAVVMLAVFGSFVLVDDPAIKVFGVGLAVAVLVDATVVRCVLGPAIMVLAGRWNWWLPGALDRRLPRVSL